MVVEAAGAPNGALADEQIVARVLAGERGLFELLMRRHNTRLYRAARAILRDEVEAEDVMQEAYVRAYTHLAEFEGRARFSSWLTRIAVHEALARRRKGLRLASLEEAGEFADGADEGEGTMDARRTSGGDPEKQASDGEVRRVLEQEIDALPDAFRAVFVLRAVEELSVAETAACLEVPEETVKTRLHRARARLQQALLARAEGSVREVFPFHRPRCDRVVAAVMKRIEGGR